MSGEKDNSKFSYKSDPIDLTNRQTHALGLQGRIYDPIQANVMGGDVFEGF